VTTTFMRPKASANINGQGVVQIDSGQITLDAGAIPYGAANIEIPLTEDLDIEDFDPTQDVRIIVTAGDDVAGVTREFNFGLRERTIDHVGQSVLIALATDEAVAQDYASLVEDKGARAYESSLRAVCSYVLGKIPGVTGNRVRNPDFLTNVDGWSLGGGTTNLRWSSNLGVGSTGAAVVDVTGTGGSAVYGPTVPVTAGQTVSLSAYVRRTGTAPGIDGRQVWIRASWSNGASANGSRVTLTGSHQRATYTGTVPAGVTSVRVDLYAGADTRVGSITWDQVQVESGPVTAYRAGVLATGPDADVSAYWQLDNLVGNPTFQVSTVQWDTASLGGPIEWSASGGMGGTAGASCLVAHRGNDGTAGAHWGGIGNGLGSIIKCKKGDVFTASMWVQSNETRAADLTLRFVDDFGYYTDIKGPAVTIGPNVWYQLTVTAACPAGRTGMSMYVLEYGLSAGILVVDAVMVTTGGEVVPYFDGLMTTDAHYTYTAAGTPHESATTRKPKVNRPPELFTWKPGVSAWDFLEPLTSSAGYRLFCDENRVWRLIDPSTYAVPGVITIAAFNTVTGSDTISRSDPEVFCTGVVVQYTWEDESGIIQIEYDTAGTPGKVYLLEYRLPYPGPGAAANILARRSGTGRTQDVTALSNWLATPGMEVTITMPDVLQQRGKIAAVDFSLSDDSLMQIGSRGLIDIPPLSWAAATKTWDAVTGTWITYNG